MQLTLNVDTVEQVDQGLKTLTVVRAALVGATITQPPVAQPQPCAPAAVMPPAPGPVTTPPGQLPSAPPAQPGMPGMPPQAPAGAPQPPQAPQGQPVDTTLLKQRLTDLTAQLGPRTAEVGQLIFAHGVQRASDLTPEQLQTVVAQTEALLASGQ